MTVVTTGRPSLEDHEAERIREAIRELLRRPKYDGNMTALGDDLQVSQPALSQILSGKNTPSLPTARRVAKLLGVEIWVLLGDVGADVPRRVVELDRRYPSQDIAAEIFRRDGPSLGFDDALIEQAIAEAAVAVHDLPADATPLRWFEHLKQVAGGIRYARKNPEIETKKREADAARALEMEAKTKPNLPKRNK